MFGLDTGHPKTSTLPQGARLPLPSLESVSLGVAETPGGSGSSSASSWRKLHGAAPITGDSWGLRESWTTAHMCQHRTSPVTETHRSCPGSSPSEPPDQGHLSTCPPHSLPGQLPLISPHTPSHHCRGSLHFLSLGTPYSQPGVHPASEWKGGKGPPADDPPHAPAPKLPSYRDCRGGKAEAYRRGDYHRPDTGSYSAHDTARSSGSATPWEQDTSQKLPHL